MQLGCAEAMLNRLEYFSRGLSHRAPRQKCFFQPGLKVDVIETRFLMARGLMVFAPVEPGRGEEPTEKADLKVRATRN
jgi:hypothetical protein